VHEFVIDADGENDICLSFKIGYEAETQAGHTDCRACNLRNMVPPGGRLNRLCRLPCCCAVHGPMQTSMHVLIENAYERVYRISWP
jgi:hypothetical protein